MNKYFCGWYYRCQSDCQTIAIIPSVHKTPGNSFCNIQILTETSVHQAEFPHSDFIHNGDSFFIGMNRFSNHGITMDIQTAKLQISGELRFGKFTPIRYDIMGPFLYILFLQCKHSVLSMRHAIEGELTINGSCYRFENSVGYLEGDRGKSFPRQYVWTQCFFPGGSLMLSVADVPLGGAHITGIIGVVILGGKEYRLATYLGAKAVKIENEEVIIRQRNRTLIAKRLDAPGHPLQAPESGAMKRTIYEHPSCNAYYRFEENGQTLLELDAGNAAFEYEY